MPYVVVCTDDSIIVKNRHYKPIFTGCRPKGFDMGSFFSSFASDVPGSICENMAWLYDDHTSPIGNVEGYNKAYFDKYLCLLTALTKSLHDIFVEDSPQAIAGNGDVKIETPLQFMELIVSQQETIKSLSATIDRLTSK